MMNKRLKLTYRRKLSITLVLLLFFSFIVPLEINLMAKKSIYFSGYNWKVKHHIRSPFGPGPNYWSSSGRNVGLDESGNLHLKITENLGRWYSSEIQLDQALGFGTYAFTVAFPERPFNKNVVLGLFNYLSDRKELDIEVTKWGENSPTNVQFVVQPSARERNIKRFPVNQLEGSRKIFSYIWSGNQLTFRCEDCKSESCDKTVLLEEWKYRGDSLPRGDLKTHINLWLLDGNPPTDGEEVEIMIEKFTFYPLEKEVPG